jgi:hypothetical protein
MKTRIAIFMIAVLLTSCAPAPNFYQVYKVEAESLQKQKDALVFEDNHCKIVYNLWAENGNIGFIFINKTDKTISINKNECFFVLNGFSYDYYQNRTYTKSSGYGIYSSKGAYSKKTSVSKSSETIQYSKSETNLFNAALTGIMSTESTGGSTSYAEYTLQTESVFSSQGTTVSKGYSVSYNEPEIIRIPPKSAKIISEFQIVSNRYRHCDLIKFPSKGIESMSFKKENSPYIFSNRICYCLESTCLSPIVVENVFYISEVSNMPYDEFFQKDYEYTCGKKSDMQVLFRKYASPDKFYYIY